MVQVPSSFVNGCPGLLSVNEGPISSINRKSSISLYFLSLQGFRKLFSEAWYHKTYGSSSKQGFGRLQLILIFQAVTQFMCCLNNCCILIVINGVIISPKSVVLVNQHKKDSIIPTQGLFIVKRCNL